MTAKLIDIEFTLQFDAYKRCIKNCYQNLTSTYNKNNELYGASSEIQFKMLSQVLFHKFSRGTSHFLQGLKIVVDKNYIHAG